MSDSKINILMIDDKSITSDLDKAGYRKVGIHVHFAKNFEQATQTIADKSIDLIVINMDYNEIDSKLLCSHFKNESTLELPVIMTSVSSQAALKKGALEAGADLFVEQPVPRDYFVEKIKGLIEQQTRSTKRIDLQSSADCKVDSKNYKFAVGDLSNSGLLLATTEDITIGSSISISFQLPNENKPIKVDGTVVRKIDKNSKKPDQPCGLGVKFDSFKGDSQSRLEKYVAKTSSDDQSLIYYL